MFMSALPTLAAETLFHLGPLPVSNSLLNAWIALGAAVAACFALRGSTLRMVPGRIQGAAEMAIEGMMHFFDQVTGDRDKTRKFFPLVGTMFFFILFSNWLGLLPGTGSIGFWETHDGVRLLVPLLRPATADLNLTLALACIGVVASHIFAIHTLGVMAHANKFFAFGTLWKALKTGNPVKIFTGCVELVVGAIEFVGEFAKLASLSLRLFGNIFAGEVLLTVISSLVAFVVPLPFMALEILVGAVQAIVFSTLVTVYLTILSATPHEEASEAHS